jgi:L-alanine-DL-glutamate epimerase-like enolase superfamily enzyme
MPFWDLIYKEPPQVKDGYMSISEKAGLGLELDPDALKKYEMK